MIPNYIWSHIEQTLSTYQGNEPLSNFLKSYFKNHPNAGSKDRKIIAAMAYSWYRISKAIKENDFKTKMGLCLQLTNSSYSVFETKNDDYSYGVALNELLPCCPILSEGINKEIWLKSMLVQPDLFIRIRKNKDKILNLLTEHGITYKLINEDCVALPNGTKIDALLPPADYVVQDASSQKTTQYFVPKAYENWYDCCAGAGGKSLLLKDKEPSIKLTVTDKREAIIHNLEQRFKLHGHQIPTTLLLDVADNNKLKQTFGAKKFDTIICDVPCSGAGTWARTPEQLFFFDPKKLTRYPSLQASIAINVAGLLKQGGRLIYITCSVFREENEGVVEKIMQETGLELVEWNLINGIDSKADSMFVAVLKK